MNAYVRAPAMAAARMGHLARLPLFFAMGGKRAVIAGGNAAAAWKVELLAAAGALVDVYALELSEEMLSLENQGPDRKVRIVRRAWEPNDLQNAAIAVGAFDDDNAAKNFATRARAAGVPVNVVDRPAFCDFSFGSIVNRSPLIVGISTDGAAPAFAQSIRARIEALLPLGFSRWAAAAAAWRRSIKTSGLSFAGRREFWRRFAAHAVTCPDHSPSADDRKALLDATKSLGRQVDTGSVVFIDAGDPDLLTLGAVRALLSADVILYDDVVSPEVLGFARREARKIMINNLRCRLSAKQEDIDSLIESFTNAGRRVVRLQGVRSANNGCSVPVPAGPTFRRSFERRCAADCVEQQT